MASKANFIPQEIIRKKRDNGILSKDEIDFFIHGVANESITEGQVAGFTMSVFFQGLNHEERVNLTKAMSHSGTTLNWKDAHLNGPVLDKHSTGGVGDKTSLILAPWLASCGAYVPMISGRGLGHTGGTLDKFDSIPGYTTQPNLDKLKEVVKKVGCAVIGQTDDLAPADRRMYAIRDISASVESIPLILSSILSKKLAEGLDGLVMDVKYGSGAFMQEYQDAMDLAIGISSIATDAGVPTTSILTDMNQVLGHNAGNALEVQEVIDFLLGKNQEERLYKVTEQLAIEGLLVGKLASTEDQARTLLQTKLNNGSVAEYFSKMVSELGGPTDLLENPDNYLPKAPVIKPMYLNQSGFISSINTQAIGISILALGGGRQKASDNINYAVGLSDVLGLGQKVNGEIPFAIIHSQSDNDYERAVGLIQQAVQVSQDAPEQNNLTGDIIKPKG